MDEKDEPKKKYQEEWNKWWESLKDSSQHTHDNINNATPSNDRFFSLNRVRSVGDEVVVIRLKDGQPYVGTIRGIYKYASDGTLKIVVILNGGYNSPPRQVIVDNRLWELV